MRQLEQGVGVEGVVAHGVDDVDEVYEVYEEGEVELTACMRLQRLKSTSISRGVIWLIIWAQVVSLAHFGQFKRPGRSR